MTTMILLFLASCWAGAQNALAGGGSFVTFPALLLAGMDIRAANVTSTVALFPSQAVSGFLTQSLAEGTPGVRLRWLCAASLGGGAIGALLLLGTPVSAFSRLVPWLVLFATAVFAWGSFGRRPGPGETEVAAIRVGAGGTLAIQAAIGVYGGYFGGGIGFMMVAVLTLAGVAVRAATASKNILAAFINLAAVVVFAFSPDVDWRLAAVVFAGSMLGSWGGSWLLSRVPERVLRGGVVAVGVALTVGLFLRQG